MEDQSSGHCASSQSEHSNSHRASISLPESAIMASHSGQHQLQLGPRVSSYPNSFGEKEDSLSPAVPSLLHLPLCRQAAPVPGLRYRNLGKSGLRVSNVGLGTSFYVKERKKPSNSKLSGSRVDVMNDLLE